MSGGSYDYLFCKIQDAAPQVASRGVGRPNEVLRLAFSNHLQLVADAMHRVEWVDSYDLGPGDEDEAIRKCLAPGSEVDAAREVLERAMGLATAVLERTKGDAAKPNGAQ